MSLVRTLTEAESTAAESELAGRMDEATSQPVTTENRTPQVLPRDPSGTTFGHRYSLPALNAATPPPQHTDDISGNTPFGSVSSPRHHQPGDPAAAATDDDVPNLVMHDLTPLEVAKTDGDPGPLSGMGGGTPVNPLSECLPPVGSGVQPLRSVSASPPPPQPPPPPAPTKPDGAGGCCGRGTAKRVLRPVYVADPDRNAQYGYASNVIRSYRYEWWNFLPLNLWKQFHEFSNVYFFMVMCISLVPGVSPITPITAIAPLVFVLLVAAIKDGYEDCVRHWADRKNNSEPTVVLRQHPEPHWTQVQAAEVRVGDIVRISMADTFSNAQGLRADVIVLTCSNSDGVCFIETAQLDGETNRKPRRAAVAELADLFEELPASSPLVHDREVFMRSQELPPVSFCTQVSTDFDAGRMKEAKHVLSCFHEWELLIEPPSDALYDWQGKVCIPGCKVPRGLTLEQTIWRGANVKKTEFVIAVVVYTGMETRLGQNMGAVASRGSGLLSRLNWAVFGIFLIKNLFLFTLCGLGAGWNQRRSDWYLDKWADVGAAETFFLNYLTWFILLSFMIPISLFVTMQLCMRIQMELMSYDHRMSYWMKGAAKDGGYGWVSCSPKTSDLNEELAGVRYIMTDKTGTLTENDMAYRAGAYPHEAGQWADTADLGPPEAVFPTDASQKDARSQNTRYWHLLALCNTVTPFAGAEGKGCTFEGTSPDEVALVRAAAENRIELCERTHAEASVAIDDSGELQTWHTVRELAFSPTRKLMSVVVRSPQGDLLLFSKGADSALLARAHWDPGDDARQGRRRLRAYGEQGWRTLAFGWRLLDPVEFQQWDAAFLTLRAAAADEPDRDKQQHAEDARKLMLEDRLKVCGVCAYEDKLQPGVPQTVRFFLDAGVSVWMLTGDKLETAVYIARNCGLAGRDPSSVVRLHWEAAMQGNASPALSVSVASSAEAPASPDKSSLIQELWAGVDREVREARPGTKTLAIDGGGLELVLSTIGDDGGGLREKFVDLAALLYSAVCCRLTPNHKSAIVDLFKRVQKETVCAVGDGGNDVNMIRAAGVGIGIIGIEGRQAELASDYAVPRFRHLIPLLAVHGRFARYRSFMCIGFSFYKNLVLSLAQVYFAMFSAFSGRTLFDSWMLAVKNTIFTGAPPLFMGCFEKDLHEEALLCPRHGPPLYRSLREKRIYADAGFALSWLVASILHGACVFWVWFPTMEDGTNEDGRQYGLHGSGLIIISGVVAVVVSRALITTKHQTAIQLGGITFSYLFFAVFICIYAAVEMLCMGETCETHFYWLTFSIFGSAQPWLFLLWMAMGLPVCADLAYEAGHRLWRRTLRDEVQDNFPWNRAIYDSRPICCCACSDQEASMEPEPDPYGVPSNEPVFVSPKSAMLDSTVDMGLSADQLQQPAPPREPVPPRFETSEPVGEM